MSQSRKVGAGAEAGSAIDDEEGVFMGGRIAAARAADDLVSTTGL